MPAGQARGSNAGSGSFAGVTFTMSPGKFAETLLAVGLVTVVPVTVVLVVEVAFAGELGLVVEVFLAPVVALLSAGTAGVEL